MTLVNLIIGSQVSYRAVEHMESNQFCGQSCHVMNPQFTAAARTAHRNTACVACHVVPGAAGFLAAKANGTRQMLRVLLGTYPKPVPPALLSDRLASSAETCEQCHSRSMVSEPRLRILSKFDDDQANTPVKTVLVLNIGGGKSGGIHGAHMGPGVRIRYRAADARRQVIPWIESRGANGEIRTWLADGAKDRGGEAVEMECADCHNRSGHAFQSPEAAVDAAMAAGQIAATLPFAHKTAVRLLRAAYASDEDAASQIPRAFTAFYHQSYPDVAAQQRAAIDLAAKSLAGIYSASVFQDLGVKWGTYPDNLGHADNAGCFRCHDGSHAATVRNSGEKLTLSQDCKTCHLTPAVDEKSPEILRELGMATGLQ
jgi:nitrate/TMAO reductase-like tetraheme cytochrome c subunit